MTAALAIALVLVVAAFVVLPLTQADEVLAEAEPGGGELWSREKAVAILAITEADFDRATGKLSDDDYRVLRSDYEGRALHAMDEIERAAPAPASLLPGAPVARFCGGCGAAFAASDLFCGACGRRRNPA